MKEMLASNILASVCTNIQVGYLSPPRCTPCVSLPEDGWVGPANTEAAINELDSLDFVTSVEHLAEDLPILCHHLSLRHPRQLSIFNSLKERTDLPEIDTETYEIADVMNKYDNALYEHFLELREAGRYTKAYCKKTSAQNVEQTIVDDLVFDVAGPLPGNGFFAPELHQNKWCRWMHREIDLDFRLTPSHPFEVKLLCFAPFEVSVVVQTIDGRKIAAPGGAFNQEPFEVNFRLPASPSSKRRRLSVNFNKHIKLSDGRKASAILYGLEITRCSF